MTLLIGGSGHGLDVQNEMRDLYTRERASDPVGIVGKWATGPTKNFQIEYDIYRMRQIKTADGRFSRYVYVLDKMDPADAEAALRKIEESK